MNPKLDSRSGSDSGPAPLRFSKRQIRALWGAGAVTLLATLFLQTPVAERLELASLDLRYRHFNRSTPPVDDVVLIDIDEQSLKLLSKSLGRWPWPRAIYSELVQFLSAGEPSGIYFDLMFSEEEQGTDSDLRLARASREAGKVSHATMMVQPQAEGQSVSTQPVPPRLLLPPHAEAPEWLDQLPKKTEPILPATPYLEHIPHLHVVSTTTDADGVYRRTPLLFDAGSGFLPSLTLRALLDRTPGSNWSEFLRNPDIPLDSIGRMSLHYYSGKVPFTVIPIATVLKSAADLRSGAVSDPSLLKVNPLEFQNKILIIGASAAGLEDLKATPVDPALPGFFLHATAISNMLQSDFLRPLPSVVSFLILIAGILSVYGVLFSGLPLGLRFGIPVGFTLLYSGSAVWLFQKQSLHLQLALPLLVWLVAGVDSLAYLIFVEGREKKRLKETLGKYLPPALADELIRTGQNPHAEVGRKEELSILFSDIRGFTTLSEGLPPERLVQILNQYLGRMTDTVFRHQGTLDKFIGDAVMAFWGAPIRDPDHALRAVRAALEMRSELKRLNEEWKASGVEPLAIGIGINTGEVIVGNIGSEQRLDYTVIGDQVNLSSRLEGLTKQYYLEVIVGPRTEEMIRNQLISRPVDLVKVKGKQVPVRIFEPLGESDSPNAIRLREVSLQTSIAFEHYLAGQFQKAHDAYRALAQLYPEGAGLSQVFSERCQNLMKEPPSLWTGIYEAKEK